MSWITEQGVDYDVPWAIRSLEEIEDLSWHNDVCPSFGVHIERPEEVTVRIWTEHPDRGRREYDRERYCVSVDAYDHGGYEVLDELGLDADDNGHWTDDVDGAIAEFLRRLVLVQAALRARR